MVCTITNNDDAGTLIVKKVVINNNGGTKIATDFSFSVGGATAVGFTAAPDANPLHGQNSLTVNAGSYSVTEPAVSGYTTTYDNCSAVSVANGATQTCTITNDDQAGTLIVKKVVINDNGGTKIATDFTFSVDAGTAVAFTASADANPLHGQNSVSVNAGSHSVTEPAVSGYTTTYDNCSAVSVANGATQTCTITNNDVAPVLTLVKQVVNTGGGVTTADAWTLTASGSGGFTGQGIQSGGVSTQATYGPANVTAGVQYTLSESGGSSSYTAASSWSCTGGGSFAGTNKITLGVGESATCTIVNTYVPPVVPTGQIAPTATTCSMYAAGTSSTLGEVFAQFKGGKINGIAPGVFFYYAFVTVSAGQTVTFTQDVTLTAGVAPSWKYAIQQRQAFLYSVNGTTCSTVVTLTNSSDNLTATGSLPAGSPAGVYILGVKFATDNAKGTSVPVSLMSPSGTVLATHFYQAVIGGSAVAASSASIKTEAK